MRLTPDLIAHVQRAMEDPGPLPGVPHFDDSDYEKVVTSLLADAPGNEPLRVFAYGSLIWNPEYEVARDQPGIVYGWHRAFCMRMERYRGTQSNPGLMLGIDRGGSCRGIVHEIACEDCAQALHKLVRRELITKPCTYSARWLPVRVAGRTVRAISFVIDRQGRFYEHGMSLERAAKRLAFAFGHLGSNAEYLMNMVRHLELYGIRDRNMCRLERMVAKEILAATR